MVLCPIILLLALGGTAVAAQEPGRVVLESTSNLPENWRLSRPAAESDKIDLRIALKQPRAKELEVRLLEISTDPSHPQYRHHLTRAEVATYQSPAPGAADAVVRWLEENDVRRVERNSDAAGWIGFTATAGQVKTILQADLGYFTYDGVNETAVLRAPRYSIPANLESSIDFIHPLAHFMTPASLRPILQPQDKDKGAAAGGANQCSSGVQPSCLRALYGINYTPPVNRKDDKPSPARMAIAGFLDQYVSPSDVDSWMRTYARNIPANYTASIAFANNATNDPSHPGSEAALDIQYALALAYPTQVSYVLTGGRGGKLDGNGNPLPDDKADNEPYLEFLEHLLAQPDDQIPHVVSISYADDEHTVPRPYAERVCGMFAQLASRGVSVLAASGDGGSTGIGRSRCSLPDGPAGNRRRATIPTFPASCPWVTAVGATDNQGPPVTGAFFSAGGFSNYFAQPEWQAEAARGYVTKLKSGEVSDGKSPGEDMYDAGGRATPDISAVGAEFVVRRDGRDANVIGTSASTPVVAAMVALVNDALLRSGANSTGWLNPALYSARFRGSAVVDVTQGRSKGCFFQNDTTGVGMTVPGWPAAEGYDLITGVGTPNNFDKFLVALR
ncbi:hypothetical protein PgNI_11159 [Pyricularia grisea]|uniref:tripeptidyl-peptidase II n=1 Tax=Pyricularia grisea TaxID=148305 RepID=A0A6P8APB7_PYRGI|nr:hypothetical protein PgNI_11159 [Pyricularia grisea]TLD03868.1 hypothetical protein PgNI_11159 [Pyricularia grisea]